MTGKPNHDTTGPLHAPLSATEELPSDRRRGSYVWCPRAILEHPALGVDAALTWSEVRRLVDEARGGWVATTAADLGLGTCLTEAKVSAALRRLERAGLIEMRTDGRRLELRCSTQRYSELAREWEEQAHGR